jgi:L-2-hydroxyglutarate oxidase LhgO
MFVRRSEVLHELMHTHENPKGGAEIPAQDRPAKSAFTVFGQKSPGIFRDRENYGGFVPALSGTTHQTLSASDT